MDELNLKTFLVVAQGADMEAQQFRIQSIFKQCRKEFTHNKLYPTLAELVELFKVLTEIIDGVYNIRNIFPGELKGIDLENRKLIYEKAGDEKDLECVIELMKWAIPEIRKTINEGVGVYEFVKENLKVEQVGIMPLNWEEGYWFIPDLNKDRLKLFQYKISSLFFGGENCKNISTSSVGEIPFSLFIPAIKIKLELIEKNTSLPEPATFMCKTEDVGFPFEETILPVAKRELTRYVLKT